MPTAPSRRAVLGGALATAAGAIVARGAEAAPLPGRAAASDRATPADPVLHAVRRLSYGATPALVAQVRQMGVTAWVAGQLAAPTSPDTQTELLVATFPTLRLPTPAQAQLAAQGVRNPLTELRTAAVVRAAFGERQLEELLVEVWTNHFSIQADLDKVGVLKVADDHDVIRPHALGTFRDLLQASAQSPAMLRYLDNAVSRGGAPNENYGRELLELHTVGRRAGYTQRDVRNAALVFTGWTTDPTTYAFRYEPTWHHVGPVSVMGWHSANADPAAGVAVGQSLLDYLATHPATARRVAGKLVRRLVADAVPASLVTSTAGVLSSSGMAIAPAVAHIVASPEFADSAGGKVKRPFDWFVASVRALGLTFDRTAGPLGNSGVAEALQRLGQLPYSWPAPDGFPDVAGYWSSTASMLSRWDVAQALVAGGVGGLSTFDPAAFLGTPVPSTAGALVDLVVTLLTGARPRPGLRGPLLRHLGRPAGAALTPAQATAATPQLAALVLSSPDMQVR